jgi:ATP-dependent exoDNAse (exonuclease V) alpha subunit
MRKVLEKANFKLLVLVGDVFQIDSIIFGNWFGIAQSFLPSSSIFELTKPFRTNNKELLELWSKVRNIDDDILEHMTRNGYTFRLNETIFKRTEADEIVLCLNYDGLYGINNINRFLQSNNENPPIQWGVHTYKVNDPILFNESERFTPLIHNNSKGLIVEIERTDERIWFSIELDQAINGLHAENYDFELVGSSERGNSIIKFFVNRLESVDEDEESSRAIVPFQIAYAISIHKAQGLEYDSVKIVVADETGEKIKHDIFYTAITRAREKLKIYWTPETENKVLSELKHKINGRDVGLLKSKNNL